MYGNQSTERLRYPSQHGSPTPRQNMEITDAMDDVQEVYQVN